MEDNGPTREHGPSTHRLPTVSASQAFQEATSFGRHLTPSGLDGLDILLQDHAASPEKPVAGGFSRGHVTEIYGPPGCGKTSLCLQACGRTLINGGKVIWVDCTSNLSFCRLQQVVEKLASSTKSRTDHAQQGGSSSSEASLELRNLQYYNTPTLPHLLALLSNFQKLGLTHTDLVVFDSLAILVDMTYSRANLDHQPGTKKADGNKTDSERKQGVTAEIAAKFVRMASVANTTILVTSHVVTRIRFQLEAVLVPALSGNEWDSAIFAKIELFRDWTQAKGESQEDAAEARKYNAARFARVVKSGNRTRQNLGDSSNLMAFAVQKGILIELQGVRVRTAPLPLQNSPAHRARKRRINEVTDTIGDTPQDSDSDYGWAEDELAAEGLVDESCLMDGEPSSLKKKKAVDFKTAHEFRADAGGIT